MPMMTECDRIERAIGHMREELEIEKERVERLEQLKGLPEIVIIYNQKRVHMAEIENQIRRAEYKREMARIREAIRKHPAIMQGGLGE